MEFIVIFELMTEGWRFHRKDVSLNDAKCELKNLVIDIEFQNLDPGRFLKLVEISFTCVQRGTCKFFLGKQVKSMYRNILNLR